MAIPGRCENSLNETDAIEHIDSLYRYAMTLSRNPADAEDLVQETYLRALAWTGTLLADSNLKAWLVTILRNIWLNIRRRRKHPHLAGEELACDFHEIPDPSKSALDAYTDKLDAVRVRATIRTLPKEFRDVLILREYDQLSYKEIAVILNCPVGTVMSRLYRAREKFRCVFTEPRVAFISETLLSSPDENLPDPDSVKHPGSLRTNRARKGWCV